MPWRRARARTALFAVRLPAEVTKFDLSGPEHRCKEPAIFQQQMDHPPLALRLAAALAHATFAASVILPALVTVRCAVGADGADRRARGAG